MNTQPRLVIVGSSLQAPGAQDLAAAATQLGWQSVIATVHQADVIQLIGGSTRTIFRVGPKTYAQYEALVGQLPEPFQTQLHMMLRAFDKVETHQLLEAGNIPTPQTRFINHSATYEGMPFVVKIPRGNQGKGVELIQSDEELRRYLGLYPEIEKFVAQEYIAEAQARDIRLFVVGPKVVTAMQRRSESDDFRANLHLGGTATSYEPTSEEVDIAIRALQACELEYGGVDIIHSERGPLVLEVNPSPGFAISAITGVDAALEVVKYITKGADV